MRFLLGEKAILNGLGKHPALRYPVKGKVKTIAQKVYLLLQCYLGHIHISDPKLGHQMAAEMRTTVHQAYRILKCIVEALVHRAEPQGICNALLIYQCLSSQCWDRSYLILTRVAKI
ncbi:ATP-dependent DNA helicase MER3, partial [Dimargaris verticillata]